MKVAIVGTGYVGLPTGLVLAYLGHKVMCVDIDQERIDLLESGICPLYEPGLTELWDLVRERIGFTSDYGLALAQADIIVIAVGTPTDETGAADLSAYWQAVSQIAAHWGGKSAVVLNKSTVPLGTAKKTKDMFAKHLPSPVLPAVVACPEFLSQGKALSDSLYPQRIVVGADDAQAVARVKQLYQRLLNQDFIVPPFLPRPADFDGTTIFTCDIASAELIKYAANAFLALKISFINEMANLAELAGADIASVAAGMGLDSRIGPSFLQAGIGWGGSCFGKDTKALLHMAAEWSLPMPIVSAARHVNYSRRQMVVGRLEHELGPLDGKSIGILGLAFKPGTDDLRDAPSLDIIRGLVAKEARVIVHDPVALPRARVELADMPIRFTDRIEDVFQKAHAVLLLTEWTDYLELPYERLQPLMEKPCIFDGRNALNKEQMHKQGYTYLGVGQ